MKKVVAGQAQYRAVNKAQAEEVLALLCASDEQIEQLIQQSNGLVIYSANWLNEQIVALGDTVLTELDRLSAAIKCHDADSAAAHAKTHAGLAEMKGAISALNQGLTNAETTRAGTPLVSGCDVAQIASQLAPQLLQQIQAALAHGGEVSEDLDFRAQAAPVTLGPPPLVTGLSARSSTVASLKQALQGTTWLALRGDSGSGKTQLAALIAREQRATTLWLRFRDLDSARAASRFDACLGTVQPLPVSGRHDVWIPDMCRVIPDGSLLVCDDIPRLDSEDPLALRLTLVVQSLNSRDVRLLSTSSYSLPHAFRALLHDSVCPVECPSFTDAEIAELLLANGAPAGLVTPERLTLFSTVTRRHPVLLVAVVRYLQMKQWRLTHGEIEDLIRGKHATPLAGDTLARLIKTVADENTRELLYRVKLATGEFTPDEVKAVASVPPVIDRPSERVEVLLGLWIQREVDDRFVLSPLIRALPEGNLPESTHRAVHLALGKCILRSRVLDPWDVVHAVVHFHSAGQHDYSAILLLLSLRSILKHHKLGDAAIILLLWGDMPIPPEVALPLRVLLRAHQIEARASFGYPTAFVVSDLDRLVDAVSDAEGWALGGVVAAAGLTVARLNPVLANRTISRAIMTYGKWRDLDGRSITLPKGVRHEGLLWITVAGLRTREHIRNWLDIVAHLPLESREKLFSDELAEHTCIVLADRLWTEEHKKPVDARDWDGVLLGLDELGTCAEQLGQAYLKACALRAKLIVLAEYKDDLASAVALGKRCLEETYDDPRVPLLICQCVAQQYLFKQRHHEAREWFTEAFTHKYDGLKLHRATTLAHASRAWGEIDAAAGVRYAEEAVRLGSEIPHRVKTTEVQFLGELGVARWLAGDVTGSFDALDQAAESLLAAPVRDAHWKGLFMCFAHTCGYYGSLARTGRAPVAARDGGPYIAPERGLFLRDHERAADLYADVQLPGIFVQLVLLADGLGHDAGADKWALRGLVAARAAKLPTVVGVLADLALTAHITRGEYDAAIDLGIECGRSTIASKHLTERNESPLWKSFGVDDVLKQAGTTAAAQAEMHGAMVALLPIVFHLAIGAVTDVADRPQRVEALLGHIEKTASASTCRQYWELLADVVRCVFVQRWSATELIQLGNRESDWLVRNLAYLGSTLQQDALLQMAVRGHLVVLSSAVTVFEGAVGSYRRIVVPFVETFWDRALARERFRFSAPSVVETDLKTAIELPINKRAQFILRTVATALGVSIPDGARSWACPPCS